MRATHHISDNRHGAAGRILPPPFRVDVAPERDVVRVCPSGEVDTATVDRLRERVHEVASAGFRRVVVDLRGVTFLDRTGLRLLLELHEASSSDGWQLGILEGSREVQRVFELAGLRTVLPFVAVEELRNSRWRSWV
jgi:anti-anti-sigma factor